MSSLYILEINSLSVVSFTINFSHSEGCLFTLLIVSFVVQKVLSLIGPHFHYTILYIHYMVMEDLAMVYVRQCSACFCRDRFYNFGSTYEDVVHCSVTKLCPTL